MLNPNNYFIIINDSCNVSFSGKYRNRHKTKDSGSGRNCYAKTYYKNINIKCIRSSKMRKFVSQRSCSGISYNRKQKILEKVMYAINSTL